MALIFLADVGAEAGIQRGPGGDGVGGMCKANLDSKSGSRATRSTSLLSSTEGAQLVHKCKAWRLE
jgi:hypothetical protein